MTVALSVVVSWVVFVSGPVVTEACPVLKDYACVRRMREEELARFLPLSLSWAAGLRPGFAFVLLTFYMIITIVYLTPMLSYTVRSYTSNLTCSFM